MKRAELKKEYPKLLSVETRWPTGMKSEMLGISYNSVDSQKLVVKARYRLYSFRGEKLLVIESLYGTSYSVRIL